MQYKTKEEHPLAKKLADDLGIDAFIANLLAHRGVDSAPKAEAFLDPDYDKHVRDPFLFTQLPRVVERVEEARKDKEKIGVFGDFDADGVTGSALLREALEKLGLEVFVHIPDKHNEGHGLSREGIDYFSKSGVTLFFTVDCGITNVEEVSYANSLGMESIIIDHHHIPEVLPDALAAINPKMPESGYPFSELCGAGTAFKVVHGIYQKLEPKRVDELKWLLDLVAVGTVADCMPLIDENRVFVKYGLIVLGKTRRVGLKELYEIGRMRIDEANLPTATTIGFQIAPRINAAGRMAHAKIAHDMLVEINRERAQDFARTLELHNKDRQKITASTVDAVRKVATEEFSDKPFILAADESYPLGIVGLVAGKIADEFNKPTAILQKGEKESQGSFRSIEGLNIIELIEQCGDMLLKYGGHAQAAGMTIANDKIEAFYEKFTRLVEEQIGKEVLDVEKELDAEIHPTFISSEFVNVLKRFEPFGLGNPEPVFLFRNVHIIDTRMVGNGSKHLKIKVKMNVQGKPRFLDGIGFGLGERFFDIQPGDVVDIVGALQENVWNGNRTLQIQFEDIIQMQR